MVYSIDYEVTVTKRKASSLEVLVDNEPFDDFCDDDDDYDTAIGTVHYTVTEDIKDIVPWLYEQHFGVPYRELGWWLEPGAKEFVKKIEDDYWHNRLDTYPIYHDYHFFEWLKERQKDSQEVYDLIKEEIENLKDEL